MEDCSLRIFLESPKITTINIATFFFNIRILKIRSKRNISETLCFFQDKGSTNQFFKEVDPEFGTPISLLKKLLNPDQCTLDFLFRYVTYGSHRDLKAQILRDVQTNKKKRVYFSRGRTFPEKKV